MLIVCSQLIKQLIMMPDTEYPKVVKVEDFNDAFANLYITANVIKLAFIRGNSHTDN